MKFSQKLKDLRYQKGVGIKKLAPEIGLNYTYISKLENDKSLPSEEVIGKISKYFDCDKQELMLAAGKIPDELIKIIQDNPQEVLQFLRGLENINDK